jgi:hypothetical protein
MWLCLRFIKPSAKAGISDGKPFTSEQEAGMAMLIKFASEKRLAVEDATLTAFSEAMSKKKGDASASKKVEALFTRERSDILGRLDALTKNILDVGGAKVVYNLYQVVFNAVMVYIIGTEIWRYAGGDIWKTWSTLPDPQLTGNWFQFGLFIHYLNKFLEYTDSIFMILSGSWRQLGNLTGLHIIHHAIMGPIWWHVLGSGLGDGSGTLLPWQGSTQPWASAAFNSFIHVLMYSYYLLSSVGVPMGWFRLPMTTMQLIQFYALFAHGVMHVYYRHVEGVNDWTLTTTAALLEIGTTVLMMFMFTRFFISEYCTSKRGATK